MIGSRRIITWILAAIMLASGFAAAEEASSQIGLELAMQCECAGGCNQGEPVPCFDTDGAALAASMQYAVIACAAEPARRAVRVLPCTNVSEAAPVRAERPALPPPR